jgi:hypothetical protein
MRESQMKKLVALAVASAFVAPVYAADISISGFQEWVYSESDGITTTELDGAFNVKASAETNNGLKVSADINIAENGANDGGSSLTLAGPFGKVDLGDTSSAVDAINDITDPFFYRGMGTGGVDAALLWTLPTFVSGLTVNVSWSGDTNQDGNADSNGVSAKYSVSGLTVGYGITDFDAGSEDKIFNVAYSFAGVNLSYEAYTLTSPLGVDTDTTNLGADYSMGDVTLAIQTSEVSSGSRTTVDDTVIGVHYSLGGGVTAYFEQLNAASTSTDDTTSVGVNFKF